MRFILFHTVGRFPLRYKKNKIFFFSRVTTYNYPLFEFTPYEINLTSKIVDVAANYNLDLVRTLCNSSCISCTFSKTNFEEFSKELPIVTTLHGTDITLIGMINHLSQ